MGFLSGLQGLFDPNRLAVAQAFASGDYQGGAAMRARQDELQRQRDLRDAQLRAAANLGFSKDEIMGMDSANLSEAIRQRALAARMLNRGIYGSGGIGGDDTLPGANPAPSSTQGSDAPRNAPLPGTLAPDPSFTPASSRFPDPPGFSGRAAQRGSLPTAALAGGDWSQMATLGNIPRLQSLAQTASRPRGSFFLAPDASLRSII